MTSSIRFTSEWPAWLVIGGALAAALLVVLYYLRETRSLGSPYAYVLPALRGSVVALALFILAGPVWHRRTIVGTLGRVVFAVDASQSMSMTDTSDSTSGRNRMVRALERLVGRGSQRGWIERLEDTHRVEVMTFDSNSPAVVYDSASEDSVLDASGLRPDGKATDLAAPLEASAARLVVSNPRAFSDTDTTEPGVVTQSAVVLMSDGRSTKPTNPPGIARQLRTLGAVVHTIGVGSLDELVDVGISAVSRPETVSSDSVLSGKITLDQHGFTGHPVDLRIERNDGTLLWSKRLIPSPSPQTQVDFSFDVADAIDQPAELSIRNVQRRAVVMDLRATVSPAETDAGVDQVAQNNSFPFRVTASTRNRRLLIIDGSSRWEIRYLRNLFQRDPEWTVDTVLVGPGTDQPTLRRGDSSGQFPDSIKAISQYDALVLGEIPFDQFAPSDAKVLIDYVSRGGGLIAIDGRFDRLRKIVGQRLEELVPVRHLEETVHRTKTLSPTAMGRGNPAIDLSVADDRMAEIWSRLPGPEAMVVVEPQPGAEVWIESKDAKNQTVPWLVTRRYGSGCVFYLASGETWRWRYKIADKIHAKFWNQLLIAAIQPPYAASDQYASIGTDKVEYSDSDTITIRAKLQSVDDQPLAGVTVDALVISEDQAIQTVAMSVADEAQGTFIAQTEGLEPGKYEIRLRASGFDSQTLRVFTPIWVSDHAGREWQQTSLDEDTLTQIATIGGGRYYHESSAESLIDQLKPLSSGQVVQSDIAIWQSYYWFWAIVGLLAIEWIARKRSRLI